MKKTGSTTTKRTSERESYLADLLSCAVEHSGYDTALWRLDHS